MKKWIAVLLLTQYSYYAFAQEKYIEKLSQHKIDSLRHIHVDTILYYHSYCGECELLRKPNEKFNYSNCRLPSGYSVTDNFIFYKQGGKYWILKFDCDNSSINQQLDTCKSIPYFISIIPVLNARDKKGKYIFAMQADGGFEEADIYLKGKKQHVYMPSTEKTDFYDIYKKYFWVNKEIKLLKLINKDEDSLNKN